MPLMVPIMPLMVPIMLFRLVIGAVTQARAAKNRSEVPRERDRGDRGTLARAHVHARNGHTTANDSATYNSSHGALTAAGAHRRCRARLGCRLYWLRPIASATICNMQRYDMQHATLRHATLRHTIQHVIRHRLQVVSLRQIRELFMQFRVLCVVPCFPAPCACIPHRPRHPRMNADTSTPSPRRSGSSRRKDSPAPPQAPLGAWPAVPAAPAASASARASAILRRTAGSASRSGRRPTAPRRWAS
jgi:hypothetical protein